MNGGGGGNFGGQFNEQRTINIQEKWVGESCMLLHSIFCVFQSCPPSCDLVFLSVLRKWKLKGCAWLTLETMQAEMRMKWLIAHTAPFSAFEALSSAVRRMGTEAPPATSTANSTEGSDSKMDLEGRWEGWEALFRLRDLHRLYSSKTPAAQCSQTIRSFWILVLPTWRVLKWTSDSFPTQTLPFASPTEPPVTAQSPIAISCRAINKTSVNSVLSLLSHVPSKFGFNSKHYQICTRLFLFLFNFDFNKGL